MALAYLSEDEVLALHFAAVTLYGGMGGVRDNVALESSLAQPRMRVFGCERFPTLAEKAAAYCFFIVRNHPFCDGNKRAGFLAAVHFLRKNGVAPEFDDDDVIVDAITDVAAGKASIGVLVRVLQSAI